MKKLQIGERVLSKLQKKHGVSISEVEECFLNREKGFLGDTRDDHKTEPPTMWFIAKTDRERVLKVVFIDLEDVLEVKTAYEPNENEVRIYEKYA